MPELPPIEVDLSREILRLRICGICKALTLREDLQAHADWHGRIGA